MQSELEQTLAAYNHNQKRAKLMIILWLGVIVVITGFFFYGAKEYEKTQSDVEILRNDLNTINEQAQADRLRIQTVLNEVNVIKESIEDMRLKDDDSQRALYVADKKLQKLPLINSEQAILLDAYNLKDQSGNDSPEILLLKGIKSFDDKEYDKALNYFELASGDEATKYLSYWAIGRVLFAQKQFDAALEQFTLALGADKTSTQFGALVDRGLTYVRLHTNNAGHLNDALADYDRSIEMGNTYPVVYRRRGLVNLRMGNTEKAIDDFDEAVKMSTTDEELASAMENRALAALKQSQWLAAIERSQTVLKINKDSAWNWAIRSIAFNELNDTTGKVCSILKWAENGGDSTSSIQYYLPERLWQTLIDLYNKRESFNPKYC